MNIHQHDSREEHVESLIQQATKLLREENLIEAVTAFQEIVSIQKQSSSIPTSPSSHEQKRPYSLCGNLAAARTLNNVGVIYKRLKQFDEAMTAYTESLRIRQILLGRDHPDLIATLSNIGSIHVQNRDFDNAMKYFLEAKRVAIATMGENNISIANILNNIGYLHDLKGDSNQAVEDFETALRIYIMAGFLEIDPVVEGTIRNIQQVLSRKR